MSVPSLHRESTDSLIYIYISSSGAQVSLQNAAITVIEDEGAAEVCVDLLVGELAIDITVLLNTNNFTADGRLIAM